LLSSSQLAKSWSAPAAVSAAAKVSPQLEYRVDASAVLALIHNEPGADRVAEALDVTVTGSGGQQVPECTLRAAIQTENAGSVSTKAITFDIPAGALGPIKPGSALPALTAAGVLIDGTTEAGGIVTIDGGALAQKADCVSVAASGVTVQGLDLANCPTGIELQPPGQDKVQDDVVGLGVDGVSAAPGVDAVSVDAGSTADAIGALMPARRDVIGDDSFGVALDGSGNVVEGDLIGTDKTGAGFAPDQIGIALTPAASGNTIGGVARSPGTGPGNVIVAGSATSTFSFGVIVLSTSNTVAGNLIGTDATGTQIYAPVTGHAAAAGVVVAGPARGDVVGGGAGSGNVIAGVTSSQVLIDGAGAVGTDVLGNTIGAGTGGVVLAMALSNGVADAGAAGAIIGQEGEGNTITGQKHGS
jgi:hypothetical protein